MGLEEKPLVTGQVTPEEVEGVLSSISLSNTLQRPGAKKHALMTGTKNPATHRFYQSAGFTTSKQGYEIRFRQV
ncbi:hypothetical protein GCM10022278_12300 [Allohahella marinimesophila]|uniref:FR47-like protein n=1 Tax=Allohahella marinimesophila TaxID=1054972 RepID=A0ABP7NWV2_9GAMM